MPNGSMDDLPCGEQHPQYRACEGYRARRTCKDCHYFQQPHQRVRAKLALPCMAEPRQGADPLCPHFRKAERPSRPTYRTG